MNEENQGTNQGPVDSSRRQSEQFERSTIKAADSNRRQTLSGPIHPKPTEVSKNQSSSSSEPQNSAASETPKPSEQKTPSKHRVNLGSATSYYFKNAKKTPLQKAISQQRKLNSSMQSECINDLTSFGEDDVSMALGDIDNGNSEQNNDTINAAELSFLSLGAASTASSSDNSSNSSGVDLLNRSTLSDTTELTASNFVFATASRQRLTEASVVDTTSADPKTESTFMETTENENQEAATSIDTKKSDASEKVSETTDKLGKDRRMSLPVAGNQSSLSSEKRRESWQPHSSSTESGASLEAEVVVKQAVAKKQGSRPPLASKPVDDRRMSLPVASARTFSNMEGSKKRRESWQPGASPDKKMKLDGLLQKTAEMRNARLQREEQRRLSSGSFAPSETSSTPMSLNMPVFSPLKSSEKKRQSTAASMSPNTSSDSAVSKRLLDDLLKSADRSADTSTNSFIATSDPSTTSAGLSEILGEVKSPTTSVGSAIDMSSKSTFGASKASPASTLSTASGLGKLQGGHEEVSKSPRPLPESVAFENSGAFTGNNAGPIASPGRDSVYRSPLSNNRYTRDDLNASSNSPFRADADASPRLSKKLTPTKLLTGSPRRVPTFTDSPARNTRSKKRLSIAPHPSASADIENMDDYVTSEENKAAEDVMNGSIDESRTGELKEPSQDYGIPPIDNRRLSSVSTGSVLNSSMRKPGSVRRDSGRRHVNFGSPEVAEFNVGSPSMNLTPMPRKQLQATTANDLRMPDDTVEIEADMRALQGGFVPPSRRATTSSPFEEHMEEFVPDEPEDDDDVPAAETTVTVELEENVEQVLNGTDENAYATQEVEGQENNVHVEESAVDMSIESISSSMAIDQTVELEANMNDLLHEDTGANEPVGQPEDKTVELELDMEALLTGASDKDVTQALISMGASPTTVDSSSTRPRRSSISSRRFSLVPASRLSLSSDAAGLDLENDEEMKTDELESKSVANASSITFASPEPDEVELTLKRNDVLKSSSVDIATGFTLSHDILSQTVQALGEVDMGETAKAMLSEVVNEVMQTTDPELELEQIVSATEDNLGNILKLQQLIQHGVTDALSDEIGHLANSVRSSEQRKWFGWLTSVANSLFSPLEEKEREYETMMVDLMGKTMTLEDNQNVLSSMANNAVQQARQKRFREQKSTLDALEDEVAKLEARLARSNGYLDSSKGEFEMLSKAMQALATHGSLKAKVKALEPSAKSLSKKFAATKGLHRWQPIKLHKDGLSFVFVGPSPEACLFLSFNDSPGGFVCDAQIDSKIYHKMKPHMMNRYQSVDTVFKVRINQLVQEITSVRLSHASEIAALLQYIEAQVGRQEQTARELLNLRERYDATLAESPCLQVEMEFGGVSAQVRAVFELNEAYPFAPVNVIIDTLEGQVDTERLRQLLIKNAKPGFGYLSRTCDVISAFLRK